MWHLKASMKIDDSLTREIFQKQLAEILTHRRDGTASGKLFPAAVGLACLIIRASRYGP